MRPAFLSEERVKAVILTEIIAPYRVKPFNLLSQYENIELEVLFFAETEGRRQWQVPRREIRFPYKILWGKQVGRVSQGGPVFFNPGVVPYLLRNRPQVIICGGWHHPTNWVATLCSHFLDSRLIVWSESTLRDQRASNRMKEKIKRWMVGQADGYIVPGQPQKRYLIYLGAQEDRIWVAPNAVDTEFFSSKVRQFQQTKEATKKEMGLEGGVVLYVGRLRDEKGIPDLLKAYEDVVTKIPVSLLLVGDGPHKEAYYRYVQKKGFSSVYFTGFQDQARLPQFYAVADVFVLPTHSDPWGLVLNEAMSAGLPVICSDAAGACEDLVEEGQNGFTYPSGNVRMLSQALLYVLTHPDLRREMGWRSLQRIQRYTPQKMAQGFADAILNRSVFSSLIAR